MTAAKTVFKTFLRLLFFYLFWYIDKLIYVLCLAWEELEINVK